MLTLRFMKSHKFYCVPVAKVVKSKDVLEGSNLAHFDQYCPFFKLYFSSDNPLKMRVNWLRIGSNLMFSTVSA